MNKIPTPGPFKDRDFYIDFVLPVLIIAVCASLLFTGRDGEVKAILTMSAGWVFKSAYEHKHKGGK